MDDSQYHRLVDELLENLLENLETADENECLDIDYQDGILNIELHDASQFIINKHAPTQQIWMSSPHSGASHFAYHDEHGTWLNTRTGEDFIEVLQNDLFKLVKLKI